MKNNKEIQPKNSKGKFHGYQEWYWDIECNRLWHRGKYKNGNPIGYEDYHSDERTHRYRQASFNII